MFYIEWYNKQSIVKIWLLDEGKQTLCQYKNYLCFFFKSRQKRIITELPLSFNGHATTNIF